MVKRLAVLVLALVAFAAVATTASAGVHVRGGGYRLFGVHVRGGGYSAR